MELVQEMRYERDCLKVEIRYGKLHPAVAVAVRERIMYLDYKILEVERLLETI